MKPTPHAVQVVLDAPNLGPPQIVGALALSGTRPDSAVSFEYGSAWLAKPQAFELDPALPLVGGRLYRETSKGLFGVLQDGSPDRWGRLLLDRNEDLAANREGRAVRKLFGFDYLLAVNDYTRQGALRFADEAGVFASTADFAPPPIASLAELAEVSLAVEQQGAQDLPDYERWLATIFDAGSSQGGARPKSAFVGADGSLWMAKFPARDDSYDLGAWEYLTHQLAKHAGLDVPEARLETFDRPQNRTFCVKRFDRFARERRLYVSAMTRLGLEDHDASASYVDLADLVATGGVDGTVGADLRELFGRAAFNVLVGNRDDHLRNHGFLREPTGWRLAPAFDVNPNPQKQLHALKVDLESRQGSLERLLATHEWYRLSEASARQVVERIRASVSEWEFQAKNLGLARAEINLMKSVLP